MLVVAVLLVGSLPATVALARTTGSEPNDGRSTATPIAVGGAVEAGITTDDGTGSPSTASPPAGASR